MMNGRHLPAGQQGMPQDMGRRRQYNQNQNLQYQHGGPIPYGYMNPYQPNYYPQQQLPPQYHNAGPQYQYGPYVPPPPHIRSPPPMQHYAHPPMPQHAYARSQPSPAMAAPYQPPPPSQTPPSTLSTHTVPAPMTPPTPQTTLSVPQYSPSQEVPQSPFRPPVRNPTPYFNFLLIKIVTMAITSRSSLARKKDPTEEETTSPTICRTR